MLMERKSNMCKMHHHGKGIKTKKNVMLHGIGVSHGIVRGVLYRETTFVPVISREEIAPEGRPDQAQKYKNARQSAEEELQKLIDSLQAQGTDKAAIFAAHQEVLAAQLHLDLGNAHLGLAARRDQIGKF